MSLAALFPADPVERVARLRSLALGARLICGPRGTRLEQALRNAERNPEALQAALEQIDALDALDRRRLLAAWQVSLRGPEKAA